MDSKKGYVVLIANAEESIRVSDIYTSYEEAWNKWNKERINLLNEIRESLSYLSAESSLYDSFVESISKLSNEDPNTINNFPHDTPVIEEVEVQ